MKVLIFRQYDRILRKSCFALLLQLKEELISVEEQRLNGGKEYTLDEVKSKLHESIK